MSSFHPLCKNSRYNLLTFYSLELNNRLFELELKLNCRITCLLRLVGGDNLIFIEWKRPFLSVIQYDYALHVWVCVHCCYCAMLELNPALMLKLGFHFNIDHVLLVCLKFNCFDVLYSDEWWYSCEIICTYFYLYLSTNDNTSF